MAGKYCHTSKDVPGVKHYAIITFGSITIPGDERSRTNPGHGYPEHRESTMTYVAYFDRAEWEKEITLMKGRIYGEDFVALVVDPATVETKVVVNVKTTR